MEGYVNTMVENKTKTMVASIEAKLRLFFREEIAAWRSQQATADQRRHVRRTIIKLSINTRIVDRDELRRAKQAALAPALVPEPAPNASVPAPASNAPPAASGAKTDHAVPEAEMHWPQCLEFIPAQTAHAVQETEMHCKHCFEFAPTLVYVPPADQLAQGAATVPAVFDLIQARFNLDVPGTLQQLVELVFEAPAPVPEPVQLAPRPLSLVPEPTQLAVAPLAPVPKPAQLAPSPLSLVPEPAQLAIAPLALVPEPAQHAAAPLASVPELAQLAPASRAASGAPAGSASVAPVPEHCQLAPATLAPRESAPVVWIDDTQLDTESDGSD
jgi:hypothetical protein